jgi:phenylacetate-coenzyme A ligase PaaK-like adenylate-forming protein
MFWRYLMSINKPSPGSQPANSSPLPCVPDPGKLKHVQALCDISRPYDMSPECDQLFAAAMREIVEWHAGHNEFYRKLLALRGFKSGDLARAADCAGIPFVLANFFKAHVEVSIPQENVSVHLTSSGTTGQKSQIFFDDWSLKSAQRMIDYIFDFYGWYSETPTNYLLYSYESDSTNKLGTAYTDYFLCKYAPVNRVFPALRRTGTGSHEFDLFGCIDRFIEFAAEGKPVRIFGFPAFLHFTLERMRALKIPPLSLSPESFVFLGGGWKGHADKAIDKFDLYRAINEQLGIPDKRIRDGFGSIEHCIPYIECEAHQFHVPTYSRVFIRDLKTLEPLGPGQKGFLHFVSPYITSVPAASIVMGDLASWHEAASCSCGLSTPYFVVHGRAGLSRNKSCAIAAAEMLGKERVRA